MAIKQGHPTVYDLSEGKTEYRYVRGKGVVLFANHGGELYSLRLQKSALPKPIDKISTRTLSQGETTLVSATVTSTTNITGNYVATVTGGTGIDSTGATTGEDIDHTLSLDLNELSTKASIVAADSISIIDSAASNASKRITHSNLLDAIAGTVGTTGLDRSGATLVVTDLHPVGVSG